MQDRFHGDPDSFNTNGMPDPFNTERVRPNATGIILGAPGPGKEFFKVTPMPDIEAKAVPPCKSEEKAYVGEKH